MITDSAECGFVRTPLAVYESRHSRTGRRCDNCRKVIQRGERYTVAALPPFKEPNSSARWWKLHLCVVCDPEGA